MFTLRNGTIKQKLTRMITLISSAALLTTCVTYLISEQRTIQQAMQRDLLIKANMMAEGCKATLAFDARKEARDNLSTFQADPSVVFACLFDQEGKEFAWYQRPDIPDVIMPPTPQKDRCSFEGDYLVLFQELESDGEAIGTLYIQCELAVMRADLYRKILLVALITLAAGLIAYLLAARLQKLITRPISNLVNATRAVTEKKDFSIRVDKESSDEIGLLIDSFNDMLHQIQQRDHAIQENERKFRTLFEASSDAVLLLKGVEFYDFNHKALQIYGCSCREELENHTPFDFSPLFQANGQESRGLAEAYVRKALENGSQRFEWLHTKRDGTVFDAEILLTAMQIGGQTVLQAVVRDISERKRAEAELRKHRDHLEEMVNERTEELETIIHANPSGIIVVDIASGKIVRINQKACELTGYSQLEIVGNSCHQIFCAGEQSRCPILSDSQEPGNSEQTLVRKDGRKMAVLKSVSRIPIDGREHLLESFIDITERKQMEQRLREAKEEAERINRQLEISAERANTLAKEATVAASAKSEFLANMSHEIRTPMNGIMGMTSLLLETDLGAEQRDYVETIHSSSQTLLTIINDILDFSKIEAGKMVIEPISFDLVSMIEEMSHMLAGRAHEKELEFILKFSPDIPQRIIGDPVRIRQILTNFISNAVKFTDDGYILVKIESEPGEGDRLDLRFVVEDTGIGIAADKQQSIFDKFTQADASTTRKYGGTGLGLAISKQLVELMGGKIGVESQPGEGSAFWFTLPDTRDSRCITETLPHTHLRSVRVLVVDDNEVNRKICSEQLAHYQVPHTVCSSGPEAIACLREGRKAGDPYPIAIIDYQMPQMDGITLAETIKADPDLRDTLLIMLSSIGKTGHTKRTSASVIDACLVKPVSMFKLMETLCAVWNAKQVGFDGPVVSHAGPKAPAAGGPEPKGGEKIISAYVLLAEDNAVNQKVASILLEKLGCIVDIVANGKEAVTQVKKHAYDIVFMDCQMPEMDGYEAAAAIRRYEGVARHTVVVAMTANAMQGDREKCIQAGMDDYIAKPIQKEVVQQVLNRWNKARGTNSTQEPFSEDKEIQPMTKEMDTKEIFNPEQVLKILDGDVEVLREITGVFIDTCVGDMEALRQAITAGQSEQVQQEAHKLKGAAANIGAERVRALALEMEQTARQADWEGLRRVFDTLQGELEQFQHLLSRYAWESLK